MERGRGGHDVGLGGLLAEVGGDVFFLGADLGLGFDAEQGVERLAVAAIGGEPELAGDGVAIVSERKADRGERAVAVVAVGIVLVGSAEAHLHVGDALMFGSGTGDGSELRGDGELCGVGYVVADEVGLWLLGAAAERLHGARQLRLHGVHQGTSGCGVYDRGAMLIDCQCNDGKRDHAACQICVSLHSEDLPLLRRGACAESIRSVRR